MLDSWRLSSIKVTKAGHDMEEVMEICVTIKIYSPTAL